MTTKTVQLGGDFREALLYTDCQLTLHVCPAASRVLKVAALERGPL